MTLREAAQDYVTRSWRVFPVGPDKQPRTTHGFHDASTNADDFDWESAAGIALAVPDDIIVIDVDPRNGGDDSTRVLIEAGCDLAEPETLVARTAGGGLHYYFRLKTDERLKGKLAPGIDVKLPGRGYTILPPSFEGGYRWLNGPGVVIDEQIVDLPECLLARIRRGAEALIDDGFRVGTPYGDRALQGELGRMASAAEGTRNDTLNRCAFAIGQLVAGGELGPMAIERLRTVAERTGLDPDEVDGTLESGYQAGMREPRSAPEPEVKPSGGFFKTYTPDVIGPPRKLLYEPFLFERALTWLWGPSGHGKSMVLDFVTTKLTQQGHQVLYMDWEAPEVEVERLQKMGADWRYLALRGMDPEHPVTLGDEQFRFEILSVADELKPSLIVFNTFTAMYGEKNAADGWNAPVREAGALARELANRGPAVVIVDHQEDPKAVKAHGGSSKKAWSDVYLKVTQDGDEKWKPGQPYFLKIENLKGAREYVPDVRGRVMGGKGFDGPLWISWEY